MKILISFWFLLPLTLSAQNLKKDVYLLIKESDYLTNKKASENEDLQFIPLCHEYVNKIRLIDENYPKINLLAFNIFFPYTPKNADEKAMINSMAYTGNSNALSFFANLSLMEVNKKLETQELPKTELAKLNFITLHQLKKYVIDEIKIAQSNQNKLADTSIRFKIITEQKNKYSLFNKYATFDCFLIAPYTTFYPTENSNFIINTKSVISFTKEEFEDKAETLKKILNATEVDKFYRIHSNKVFKSGITKFSDFTINNFWVSHTSSYFDPEKTSPINYEKFDFINYLGIINSQIQNSNYLFKAVEINDLPVDEALLKIRRYTPILKEE